MNKLTSPLKPLRAHPNRILTALYNQVSEQQAVLRVVKAGLSKDLADQVLHCVINQQKLILFTESANWASQLRFYSKAILTLVQSNGFNPNELVVKIAILPTNPSNKTASKALIPSKAIAKGITAQSRLVSDPELQNALARLGKTLSRLSAFEADNS